VVESYGFNHLFIASTIDIVDTYMVILLIVINNLLLVINNLLLAINENDYLLVLTDFACNSIIAVLK